MRGVKIIITTILFCLSSVLLAQSFNDYYKKANRYYKIGDYHRAAVNFRKAIRQKPGNAKATYRLGLAYLAGNDKKEALKYIEKVYKLNPRIDSEVEYYLGMAYQYHHRFAEAKAAFARYKERNKKRANVADYKIRECIFGDSLIRNPLNADVENMGKNINSRFNDYTPLIYNNGKSMILTSNRPGSTGGLRLSDGTYYEDIYVSHLVEGIWSKPEKIGGGVNIKYHDAAASISPDGKMLFLYYEKGGGDIYVSKYVDGEWTKPEPLNDNINTFFWETAASITADGKTLYFTSDRAGGMGDLDIYKSELNENGEWGEAVNLGPVINTPLGEDAPYIHPDGKTLYFGSNGHLGMGSHDIFYSDIKDGVFQEPVNMGYPINTVFNDNYFVITPDRKRAYYASLRPEGEGMADIYSIDIEQAMKPKTKPFREEEMIAEEIIAETKPEPLIQAQPETEPETEDIVATTSPVIPVDVVKEEEAVVKGEEKASVKYYDEDLVKMQKDLKVVTILKGKVIDASTAKPLYARLRLMNNETNTMIAELTSDPNTGEFELIIPHGGNYGVSTSKLGYLFNSINFDLPAFHEFQEIDTHIILQKAKVGSKVVLKNIFFDIGKSDLRTESLAELDGIKELLSENALLQVQINGHTDNVGNSVYNKVLSKKRAQAVVDYLIANGIDAGRLSAKGFGEERPLVSNDDEKDGREINRRTEIEITGVGDPTIVSN
ncbi:PD40 domain-containing protein [Fulvivirga sp. 29W222]|uniref:PD40 domain-containing protein n=1 Tax=Fulvivirga marina TaxID=2494733 RepID=A0A937FVN9_9BACT|nr:OmpA family protein [Fulvivirga marina]MBL6445200.1 PD40 domain-containing protein [Fulvivirga marina]